MNTWNLKNACYGVVLGMALLSTPAFATNIGRAVEEAVKRQTETLLADHAEYRSANPARKKQIHEEMIREQTHLEMQRVMTPMQRRIDQKIDQILVRAMPKALGPDDPRLPQIHRAFKREMYVYMNHGEETSAIFGIYEAAENKGIGGSLETTINETTNSDTSMTKADCRNIFDAIAPRISPPLNDNERVLLSEYFFNILVNIR